MKSQKGSYMNIARVVVLAAVLLAASSFNIVGEKMVDDFKLRNVDGHFISLKDFPDAKGFIVVFTCNHCPFAKLYPPRLNDLNQKYKKKGFPVIAISSTDTVVYEDDSYDLMVAKARNEHFNFPYLQDNMQTVARNFGAQKTPHAYVLWKTGNKYIVKYNGAIDDNGAEPEKVTHHYVADAVDELLAGKPVSVKETKSIGCRINLRK